MNKIRIVSKTNCWEWTACKFKTGYAQFTLNGKTSRAHRVSYELFKGNIPIGLQLDHLCKNKSCVNPDHLEAVTCKENNNRGNSGKKNLEKTCCPQGHEYNEKNTYLSKRGRDCRICRKRVHDEYVKNNSKKIKKDKKTWYKRNRNRILLESKIHYQKMGAHRGFVRMTAGAKKK